MKTLFFGAGPMGSLYAHLFVRAGHDVTVLARGERYARLRANGLSLVNEMTGEKESGPVNLVDTLKSGDSYDLVVVLIRKSRLTPVMESLAACPGIETVLFMGNNAEGFDAYRKHLPADKLLFGFPGAGGGICEQTVHYADREKPNGKRKSVTLGEMDGRATERLLRVRSLFESAGVPVSLTPDIDGWLKYHAALVVPLVGALYKHGGDNHQAAQDKDVIRTMIRAAREGGRVLRSLGYRKRRPFQFNLFYWLPVAMNGMAVKGLLESRFAEVAFAMHAKAARDEMREIAREFQALAARTSVETPDFNRLCRFIE